jgi:hypothetical protein
MSKGPSSVSGFCVLCLLLAFACNYPATEAPPQQVPPTPAPETPTPVKPASPQPPQPPQTNKYDMRFGIGGGLYPDIKAGEVSIFKVTRELDKLGMVWLRHPGTGISWREVQPTRDTWDFGKLDAVVQDNDHPWLFPTYGMIGNPYPFNADFSKEYINSLGGKEEIMAYIKANAVDMSDPVQRADAEVYVKTLVDRYKDRIRYWEIGGNEGIPSPGRFEIVVNTYAWIKEVQPDALVVVTAVGGDDDNQFYTELAAFDSLLERGMGDYFDIAHFHYYGVIEGELEERLEQRFDEYKAIMDKHGVRKPIWVTETSTSSYEKSIVSGAGSEEIQARHVVVRMVVFAGRGAEKVFWYNFGELTAEDKFYGCNIYDSVQGPKPAYFTFKLLVDKLGYYKKVEMLRADEVRLYRFALQNGGPIFVAWSDTPHVLDLSDHTDADRLLMTHIIEDDSTEPRTEVVQSSGIPLSPSPVFIEPAGD